MNVANRLFAAALVVVEVVAAAPCALTAEPSRTQLAFPGAEGFGRHGLSTADPADAAADRDGYTNLEEWLNR